jgi:hypothetical protein
MSSYNCVASNGKQADYKPTFAPFAFKNNTHKFMKINDEV